jgi:outer membrane receptor for ferric coprogen and ferric-rhodotorulic acid
MASKRISALRKNAAARWKRNEMDVYNAFLKLEHSLDNGWKLGLTANHMRGKRDFSGQMPAGVFPTSRRATVYVCMADWLCHPAAKRV